MQKKIGGPVQIFQHKKRVASTQCIFVHGLNCDSGSVLSPASYAVGEWMVADRSRRNTKRKTTSQILLHLP